MPAAELRFREFTGTDTLPPVVARDRELARLAAYLRQPTNIVLHGRPGSGKTVLAHQALNALLASDTTRHVYTFAPSSLLTAVVSGERIGPFIQALAGAAIQLAPAVIFVEGIEQFGTDDPLRKEIVTQLLGALLNESGIQLLVTETAATSGLASLPFVSQNFQFVTLNEPADEEASAMVRASLSSQSLRPFDESSLAVAVQLGRRYGERALPDSALRLLRQAEAETRDNSAVSTSAIQAIVAQATGIPLAELSTKERAGLGQLENELTRRVVGQGPAIATIASTIQRARLGLTDPHRPRGSFLLLGPSGVGKTETAKAVSELVFGSEAAMVRLDMSEYGDAHTAARLTGSPPGYVGYEAGGQLTNPIAAKPYSLVLFDELEKAHRRLHDVLLQVLDDGRLTDATGKLVDFRETIIVATSNAATRAIIDQSTAGGDVYDRTFFDDIILPILLESFRPEFINRFDAILIYEPLSDGALLQIAKLGLAQLADRLADHQIQFAIPDDRLRDWLAPFRNPLLGARPVRRMLRDRLETPIARELLRSPNVQAMTITGEEPWLK